MSTTTAPPLTRDGKCTLCGGDAPREYQGRTVRYTHCPTCGTIDHQSPLPPRPTPDDTADRPKTRKKR